MLNINYIGCSTTLAYRGGQVYYNTGVYTKIVPEECLEFTQSLSDADGNPIDPADVGMPPDFPKEVKFVIEFKALGDFPTELTITEHEWLPGQMGAYANYGRLVYQSGHVTSWPTPAAARGKCPGTRTAPSQLPIGRRKG